MWRKDPRTWDSYFRNAKYVYAHEGVSKIMGLMICIPPQIPGAEGVEVILMGQ